LQYPATEVKIIKKVYWNIMPSKKPYLLKQIWLSITTGILDLYFLSIFS